METFEKIKQIVREVTEEDVDVKLDSEFKGIGLNSISFIRMVVAVEEKYGIEFDDEYLDYGRYNTFSDFCIYVERLLCEQKE